MEHAKRGRPRGLTIFAPAVEFALAARCLSKTELCKAAGITPGHLADMLTGRKGASHERVRAMASALGCPEDLLAPTLTGRFIDVRPGDTKAAA